MTWTTKPPTQPGFYWFRDRPGKKRRRIIEVAGDKTKRLWMWSNSVMSNSVMYRLETYASWYPKAQWSSEPIQEPKEAE